MAEPSEFPVIEEEPEQDKRGDDKQKGGSDSSGFGLVNWLFDHVKEREPIFLHLYKGYDRELKLSGGGNKFQKGVGVLLLLGCLLWDGIVFLIYGLSVVLIIVGITFIFIKGSGVLEYFHGEPEQKSTVQINVNSDRVQIIEQKK